MKNKVVVTIADREYTMLAAEDDTYVKQCAAHVDSQLRPLLSGQLSQADAAVLAAMNIADQYFQQQETAESLRRQIKEVLDESAQLKMELSECKREIFKLSSRK